MQSDKPLFVNCLTFHNFIHTTIFIKMFDITELQTRMNEAKRFLNTEISVVKTRQLDRLSELTNLGAQLNSIHEMQRKGIRHLKDLDFIKIQRILTSIEARMKLSDN